MPVSDAQRKRRVTIRKNMLSRRVKEARGSLYIDTKKHTRKDWKAADRKRLNDDIRLTKLRSAAGQYGWRRAQDDGKTSKLTVKTVAAFAKLKPKKRVRYDVRGYDTKGGYSGKRRKAINRVLDYDDNLKHFMRFKKRGLLPVYD